MGLHNCLLPLINASLTAINSSDAGRKAVEE
jgi:hypothetical protein